MRHPNPSRKNKPKKELGTFAAPIGGRVGS
jgi:hypothetical protein